MLKIAVWRSWFLSNQIHFIPTNNDSYSPSLFLIDASTPFGKGDEFVLDKIKDMKVEKFIIVFDEYKKKNERNINNNR